MANIHRVEEEMLEAVRDRNATFPIMSEAATNEVEDDDFFIVDGTDNTKRLIFSVGGLTTATDRTLTVPDRSFTLGGGAGTIQPYLLGSANLTLTEAMSGSVIECGAAEDFTLPALVAADIGTTYEFVVTTTATSLTITAATGDLLLGGVSIMSTSAGLENDAFSADGTDDLILTMNGTTQGGIVGSWVRFTAASATSWLVRGGLIGSGTLVTPFS